MGIKLIKSIPRKWFLISSRTLLLAWHMRECKWQRCCTPFL